MALVVEDGTGKVDANGYIDTDFADTYFADRGLAAWTGTPEVKAQAIIKATDYIETRFGSLLKGTPEFPETPQALSFPRVQLFDRYGIAVQGIPTNLKKATAEYAVRALLAPLMPDLEVDASGQQVTSKREKIGPLEEEVVLNSSASAKLFKPYPAADRLLMDYINHGGRTYR